MARAQRVRGDRHRVRLEGVARTGLFSMVRHFDCIEELGDLWRVVSCGGEMIEFDV